MQGGIESKQQPFKKASAAQKKITEFVSDLLCTIYKSMPVPNLASNVRLQHVVAPTIQIQRT